MDSDADPSPHPVPVLALVSAGGVLGALARHGMGVAWPSGSPWTTWTINVSGSFLIGVLMTAIARWRPGQRYLRPFLGVGILGGFTTFSASMTDLQHAPPTIAVLYLFATLAGALLAVWLGSALTGLGAR